jgi:YD repeat-containing protein
MTKVTDALNQIYNFTYDPLGRQLSQTRAGTTMSYEYDAVGNRTKRTDYSGRVTDYVYDDLNRLTNINYEDTINSAAYEYDDLSRLTFAANDAGTISFTYDNRNRIETTTDVFGHTIEYEYDENGNRSLLKLDGANHTGYIYDAANRLTQLTDEANQNFTFGYDAANRLTTKTLPNNIATTYNYDGMSRLAELKHQSQAATLMDNDFSYNAANQISQIAELAQTKNFTYDTVDRLTNMTSASLPTENYAFDAVGNRTSSHLSATYGYQPFNKLTATQNYAYTYDDNGNLLTKPAMPGNLKYTWDNENRMTEARFNQFSAVYYDYDALGRRVGRRTATVAMQYSYDGLDVISENSQYGSLTIKYQNGLGIDQKLKMTTNGQAEYFLADHLGSTVALTDTNGNVTSSASYDSFGNMTGDLTTRLSIHGAGIR